MYQISDHYLSYLSQFESVDIQKIGKFVAKGKQHYVYEYSDNQVIKIPRDSIYMNLYGKISAEDIEKEIKYIKKFFPENYIETSVAKNNSDYVIFQRYYKSAQPLQISKETKQKIEELLKNNKKIEKKYGLSVDLFGFIGLVYSTTALLTSRPHLAELTNVLYLKKQKRAVIVDTNLNEVRTKAHPSSLLHTGIDFFVHRYSDFLLNFFLKKIS